MNELYEGEQIINKKKKKKIYQAKSRITGKRRAIKVILHEEENKLKNAVKIVKET